MVYYKEKEKKRKKSQLLGLLQFGLETDLKRKGNPELATCKQNVNLLKDIQTIYRMSSSFEVNVDECLREGNLEKSVIFVRIFYIYCKYIFN